MTLGQAIALGIVQGLTEFLPISSTAHLYLVPQLLGWAKPTTAFVAVIQLGTMAAVFLYFWQDIITITRSTIAGKTRLGWMIAVGTVPVVVLGLLFKKQISSTLTGLSVIAGAMIGLAVLLALAEWIAKKQRTLEHVGWGDAIVVGLAQAVALIPGASRSGCTITGGLFLGLTRETAARFSFLLSLPAITAAGLYQLAKEREALLATTDDVFLLLVATTVSFGVGYASIAFLLSFLKRHTTWVFVAYRLLLGGMLVWLLQSGRLAN
ncbi:MAG: Undecaprenyl-diphosphatase [Verrucomicrobiae bacterium]|nr:Undecaprenyl-diphosphatase [Verrucomicrobiae bacterium]